MGNLQQTMTAKKKAACANFEMLEYPACADQPPAIEWDGWEEVGESGVASSPNSRHGAARNAVHAAVSAPHAEETRRSFEDGRERGIEEGRKGEREAQAAALAAETERRRRQLAALAAQIAEERDRFLRAMEQEVVKLALAVAARILRREAQMDPLLLTGAVRVALGQLAGSSDVRLLVPASEADLWAETIAALPNLAARPVVVATKEMHAGECVVESKVGSVDLGVRSQMGEIERGFFDRSEPSHSAKAAGTSRAPAALDASSGLEQP
jgi:flagellar assembly protein FliH